MLREKYTSSEKSLMYNLIQQYLFKNIKTFMARQHYRDEPGLDNNNNIGNFPGNSASFNSKLKITGKTPTTGNTKKTEMAEPIKYLSNFWRTFEISLSVKFISF